MTSAPSRDAGAVEVAASAAAVRERVGRDRAELEQRALAERDGVLVDPTLVGLALGRARRAAMDRLLVELFAAIDTKDEPVALAAVGSYGRGALALEADLDVRLLARRAERAAPIAEALLYPLWDAGLAVGHQVVTVDEVVSGAATDLPTATALLDWRHLAGDAALATELRARAEAGLFAHSELPRFMARLADEVEQRHGRFGGSVYLLEPDVKNGQGTLRDLDVAWWAAKARFGAGSLEDLVQIGALVPREAVELAKARELFWSIRNLLHARARRKSDRLAFDEQVRVAALLGYRDDRQADAGARDAEAAERLMSDVYRAARTVTRGLETILSRATPVLTRRRPRDEDLGDGVRLFDGNVTASDAELLRADPALAFRLVAAAVERDAPLLPWARDAIGRACSDPLWCEHLREQPEARRRFLELVATCKETPKLRRGTVVRELHDLGLLLAMIPEFSPVVGRVHHDVYHVYTVDVHSVAAVDRLAALVRGDLAGEFPLACRLAAEVARPTMLVVATLLHDVGKAIGGRDHSQRGAEMAHAILARLGMAAEDVQEACHLILKHLLMYHVATKRDLDDPASIEEFVREVHGPEGLRDLYLLTVADLSTTSPTSMTSWKARMLDELYLAADARLATGSRPSDDARRARARQDVLDLLGAGGDHETVARRSRVLGYIASMPERYLLSNAPVAIVAHADLAAGHERSGARASVALVPTRHADIAEICVVAADRPGLLAAITAAIGACRLEVHGAEIHSRSLSDGSLQAVDLFWVRDRGGGLEGVERALSKLGRDLDRVLAGQLDPRELARPGRAAGSWGSTPRVSTRIAIDDRASSRNTVIEVVTRDRPGLLFAIADALHRLGLGISVAKINTEGTRVADVFYVSEADGSKVAAGARAAEVEAALSRAVASLDS